jgi:hypothetical protein
MEKLNYYNLIKNGNSIRTSSKQYLELIAENEQIDDLEKERKKFYGYCVRAAEDILFDSAIIV